MPGAGESAERKEARVPRPLNCFMLYAAGRRRELQEQHPTVDNKVQRTILFGFVAASAPRCGSLTPHGLRRT